MKSNLFIAHTPYHLTLAMAIIKSENLTNNILLVYNTFNISDSQINKLNNYFEEIHIIEIKCKASFINKFSIKEWITKCIEVKYDLKNFEYIISKLKEREFKKIFFSNNTDIEVQILIDTFRRNSTEVYYIEDGCAAYHDIVYEERLFTIKKILIPKYAVFGYKYKFFRKFSNVSVIGLGRNILGGYYVNKQYIREELKNMESHSIDMLSYKEVIKEYYSSNEYINNSIVLIMDHSESGYCNEIINILKFIKDTGKLIYIKYHPRETNFYSDFLLDTNIRKLDTNINIESILVNTYGNIIIGNGGSTTFLTCPLICNNKYIITNSLFNLNINSRLIEIVKNLGAIEINNFNDIIKIMD